VTALGRAIGLPASVAGIVAGSLLLGADAAAHPTPGSVALLDFTVDGARLEQDVPLEELERALHQQLVNAGESANAAVQRQEALLRDYASQHVRASSAGSDQPWSVRVLEVDGHDAADGPRARFRFALSAPGGIAAGGVAAGGVATGSVALHDDLVTHEVISHYTTVHVRSDWAADAEGSEPRLAGTLHAGRNDLTIDRHGSLARGLKSIVGLGAQHIATGTDHLLFLFALVLVAPVTAVGGTWQTNGKLRDALLALARVVTAFTLGHSATLALGALGGVTLPSALVEAAIAASILVTALHALRPLFARREALVAGLFGLVHGLAFASTLQGRDLGGAQAAWTLFGFNLGIELAQLGLLALVLPWLLLAAQTRTYRWLRTAGGTLALLLAAGWLVERTLGVGNPLARPLGWLEAHPLLLLFALAGFAGVARMSERSSRRGGEAASPNDFRASDPICRPAPLLLAHALPEGSNLQNTSTLPPD
jgi:hypothetical protein